mmetsp:Transcript_380/g.962  ORF Transcript_380/g.962 Transcript_380/m.962 type:complete len:293 (+) Transcript_380:61-939(+)|eukprot:5681132-Prymnesium_polylepis.1
MRGPLLLWLLLPTSDAFRQPLPLRLSAAAAYPCDAAPAQPLPPLARRPLALVSSQRARVPVALFGSLRLPETFPDAAASSTAAPDITVRGARMDDAVPLASLCTDAFFGTHRFVEGPIIFIQRAQIYSRVLMQVSRRLRLEDGRECRLLVATDGESGAVCGCVDLAVHLFNERERRFELTIDEMPTGRGTYSWQPYVASLAVQQDYRRRGIARLLMHEAEVTAKQWGYNQIMLEVAQCNEEALSFYRRRGYGLVREDSSGTGATEVTVRFFWWDVRSVEKFIMRRSLGGVWA